MVSLYRFEELVNGVIAIDGIDISCIPVQALRRKLCIIPQDPVLFSATIRFNLDPFDENNDEAVWAVLHKVCLADYVTALPGKLEELVTESGDNFSAGQRQVKSSQHFCTLHRYYLTLFLVVNMCSWFALLAHFFVSRKF